jgi:predicted nucleic acid-binding protein
MRRLIIDTNLYIDWLNAGKHESIIFQPDAVKFMSAVVMMELLAGACSAHERTRLHDLFTTFTKLGRIVTPSSATYQEAGDVLRQLQTVHGFRIQKSRTLANDVLIALSARTIGGTVVTRNKQDFLAIQSIRVFNLSLVS